MLHAILTQAVRRTRTYQSVCLRKRLWAIGLQTVLQYLDRAFGVVRHPQDLGLTMWSPCQYLAQVAENGASSQLPYSGSTATHLDIWLRPCNDKLIRMGTRCRNISREYALVYDRAVLLQDVLLVRLVPREEQHDPMTQLALAIDRRVWEHDAPSKYPVNIGVSRGHGQRLQR